MTAKQAKSDASVIVGEASCASHSLNRRPKAFDYPGSPSELLGVFRTYYGPTMNAFEAAEKNGKAADLQRELEALFTSQNKSTTPGATSIPATFLRVTVEV